MTTKCLQEAQDATIKDENLERFLLNHLHYIKDMMENEEFVKRQIARYALMKLNEVENEHCQS